MTPQYKHNAVCSRNLCCIIGNVRHKSLETILQDTLLSKCKESTEYISQVQCSFKTLSILCISTVLVDYDSMLLG